MKPSGRALSEPMERSGSTTTKGLTAVLIVSLYYLSYRYPLQINSADTSPSYSNTPLALQIGKYVVLASVAVIVATSAALHRPKSRRIAGGGTVDVTLTTLSLWSIAILAFTKATLGANIELLTLATVLGVGAIFAQSAASSSIDFERLGRVILAFAFVSLVVEIVQVYLYRSRGRLPALAYEGSVSVRFGSILDDPNGFAILIALLATVAWLLLGCFPVTRIMLALGFTVSLILTQSFTGYAATSIAVLVTIAAVNAKSHVRVWVICYTAITAGTVLVIYVLQTALYESILETKRGSIDVHAEATGVLLSIKIRDLAGFGFDTPFTESGFVRSFFDLGAAGAIILFLVGIASVRRLFLTATDSHGPGRATLWGFFCYQIAFMLGNLNLPLYQVFPLNILFVFGAVISLYRNSTVGLGLRDEEFAAPRHERLVSRHNAR